MAKQRAKAQAPHRVDGKGQRHSLLPHVMIDSPQWRQLSFRARVILDVIIRRFNGWNNGQIAVSQRDLADQIGSWNYSANSAALRELITAGFLAVGRAYPKGSRMAREYRLTFASYGSHDNPIPATNEWLQGETNGKGKQLRPLKTETEEGKLVSKTETEGKLSGSETETDATETCGVSPPASGSKTETHIIYHTQSHVSLTGKSSSNHQPDHVGRSLTAFMDGDELRDWTLAHINKSPPGEQTRLAKAAGVPGGTLSKFLKGRGLSDHHRKALQLAVGQARPLERIAS